MARSCRQSSLRGRRPCSMSAAAKAGWCANSFASACRPGGRRGTGTGRRGHPARRRVCRRQLRGDRVRRDPLDGGHGVLQFCADRQGVRGVTVPVRTGAAEPRWALRRADPAFPGSLWRPALPGWLAGRVLGRLQQRIWRCTSLVFQDPGELAQPLPSLGPEAGERIMADPPSDWPTRIGRILRDAGPIDRSPTAAPDVGRQRSGCDGAAHAALGRLEMRPGPMQRRCFASTRRSPP